LRVETPGGGGWGRSRSQKSGVRISRRTENRRSKRESRQPHA
jgi:N-methylhydantoinase B/oxoprolinase/acetone carboxylase alpha subunit